MLLFTSNYDFGLFLLRLAVGVVFLVHGIAKIKNPSQTAKQMGGFMVFIGVAETLGGIALLTGFLTELAAIGLAIIMIGATYKKIVTWHMPFTAMDKTGWEFDIVLLGALFMLILAGAGALSVDAMLGWWP